MLISYYCNYVSLIKATYCPAAVPSCLQFIIVIIRCTNLEIADEKCIAVCCILLFSITRPPDGIVSALRAFILSALAGLCPPYLLRFLLNLLSRPCGPL